MKDRAKRYHKSSIFSLQSSIPAYPGYVAWCAILWLTQNRRFVIFSLTWVNRDNGHQGTKTQSRIVWRPFRVQRLWVQRLHLLETASGSDQDPEYPTSPHWVKKIYKYDENRIPLIRVGWVFFNPERWTLNRSTYVCALVSWWRKCFCTKCRRSGWRTKNSQQRL